MPSARFNYMILSEWEMLPHGYRDATKLSVSATSILGAALAVPLLLPLLNSFPL